MVFYLFLLLVFLGYIFYLVALRKRNRAFLNKFSIYEWMKMGRQNRKKLDQKQKLYTLHKKKNLIGKIRKEYINYKKSLIK